MGSLPLGRDQFRERGAVRVKRLWSTAVAVAFVLITAGVSFSAVQPVVVGVDVTGNQEVVSEHILGVVGTKAGDQLSSEQIQQDIDTIYGLGFFSYVDVGVVEQFGGVFVEFRVQENPVVQDIRFSGNTVFTADELMEVVFTRPGSVFNRVFFRHDLQRIGEKYEKAGYVFVQVQDVGIQDGVIDVMILEPKIGEVIIQGNTKTKTHVLRREIKLQEGDLFNAIILRHSINKLNQLGFLEDIRVGFEPTPNPEVVNIVLTVEEGKTSRISFSIGHGSQSGWTGGAAYEEINHQGLGRKFTVGFEINDWEDLSNYWASYEEPYMDETHYRWRAKVYKYTWEDLIDIDDIRYDQDQRGISLGAGKKFTHDPTLSWFVELDWHEVEFDVSHWPGYPDDPIPNQKKFIEGRNLSVTGTLSRNLIDPYLSYPKGEVQSLSVEQGFFSPDDPSLGEMNYTKYWIEARYYWPLYNLFQDLLDRQIGTEDNPVLVAARVRVGFSSGELPWSEQYFLGGSRTLRGYRDNLFSGSEMALGNVELRVPIQESISIVAFYDIGMASDGSVFSDLVSGYGFGVRVRTPMGNMRLDFAEGEYETRTHFGFGEMF